MAIRMESQNSSMSGLYWNEGKEALGAIRNKVARQTVYPRVSIDINFCA